MDSVKAGLDLRFAHAKDGFARMAVQAAVIVALMVFAAIAGAGALGGSVTCTAGCADGIGFAVAATKTMTGVLGQQPRYLGWLDLDTSSNFLTARMQLFFRREAPSEFATSSWLVLSQAWTFP